MDEIRFRTVFHLEVAPDRLWPLLSNTDRLNRALGLPPVIYHPRPADDPGPTVARSTYLGMRVEWREHPFEWVHERRYAVERIFPSGIVRRIYGGVELRNPAPGHTEVEVFTDVTPRNLIGWVAAKTSLGPKATRGMETACRNFVRWLGGDCPDPYPRAEAPPRADRALLELRMAKVVRAGIGPELVARLRDLVTSGHDEQVVRVRPFEVAERWKMPRMEVLRGFLFAAAAELFDLEWEVLCPNCRVVKAGESRLDRLLPQAHCDFCNIRFDLQFDLNVELRFSVNPNVRFAEHAEFCIGGPGNTPHVLAQVRLPAGGSRNFSIDLPEGKYRVRVPRIGEPVSLDVSGDAPLGPVVVRVTPAGVAAETLSARPGEVALRIESELDREALVMVEDRRWHALGAPAALVTTLQDFRDLFSSEALAPDMALSIRSLAILFTDLRGSTALYELLGDNPAFSLVRRHFAMLTGVIRDHQGALIKTIGDAVMAAFHSNVDCARAALEIQRAVVRFNGESPGREIVVKLGAHAGPCVAVNANGALDYFGTTVNLAARIQNESHGRDFVLSHSMASEPGVSELLARDAVLIEDVEREVKGLSRPVRIVRVWPAERGSRK